MTCSKCGICKPFSEFYVDRSKSTGRRPDCKTCVKARNGDCYRDHIDRLRPAKRKQMRRHRAGRRVVV